PFDVFLGLGGVLMVGPAFDEFLMFPQRNRRPAAKQRPLSECHEGVSTERGQFYESLGRRAPFFTVVHSLIKGDERPDDFGIVCAFIELQQQLLGPFVITGNNQIAGQKQAFTLLEGKRRRYSFLLTPLLLLFL